MEQNETCCKHIDKTLIKLVGIVLVIFLLASTIFVLAGAVTRIKQVKNFVPSNTFPVTETGEIYVKPDLAEISFTVLTEAKTVATALSDNSAKMNKVIDFIKSQGVEDKDIKTTNFSISPHYEYEYVQPEIYPYPPGKQVLSGYEVNQQINVKIRELAKVGAVIQGASDNGANQTGNLQFTIDNQDEAKAQARALAIEKAKAKAKELSKQVGIKLGDIVNFSENISSPWYYASDSMNFSEKGGGAPAPQIQTGENKVSVSVTIIYEIE